MAEKKKIAQEQKAVPTPQKSNVAAAQKITAASPQNSAQKISQRSAPENAQQSNRPDPNQVARRAYERFQERGGEHGRDQEDWIEAEKELSQK